jgi:PiT family inorganic phosphate transporter
MQDALIVAAAVFAVVAGSNDGSAILSAGLSVPGLRPIASLVLLLAAVVVGPLFIFGMGVATTLAHRLVPFHGAGTDPAVLVATVSAVAVVFALTRAGLPTSLTLALIGAITGVGLGTGMPVSGGVLAEIVVVGLAAPVLAALLAFAVARILPRAVGGTHMTRRLRRLHVATFSLQCLAYSANGGQKMLAVFAFAVGAASGGAVRDPWWLAVAIAALFGIGVSMSLRRVSANLGKGIMPVHLRHTVIAETCSFALVMGAGVAGVPLTMSQSLTGALVGAGASEARTRVRWTVAMRMAGAWTVTLPASIGLSALAGLGVRWL